MGLLCKSASVLYVNQLSEILAVFVLSFKSILTHANNLSTFQNDHIYSIWENDESHLK